jgi:site-specific DNA recombinase
LRIVAYCRVSTDQEEQLESLNNQKSFFEQYANTYNHTLVNIYADEGISGKQIKNRNQFLKMLNDSDHNIFDMVVVKDISRFARNTVDFLNAIRQLRSKNIEVQFLSNNQTILGNSEFILTIFSALAQEESANLSKRIKFGKKINAKKGRVPNIIYGYDQVDNYTLKINEDEAKIIKIIFENYISGDGARKVAIDLNDNKIPSKKGSYWTSKVIRRILCNSIYYGIMINNKSEIIDYMEGKRQLIPKDKNISHERPEYAIIDKETFDKAQESMKVRQVQYKNKEVNTKGRYSNKHIFSTLIKCVHCGYSYSRKSYKYKNERIFWKCTGNDQFGFNFCSNNITINESELLLKVKEELNLIIANDNVFINNNMNNFNINKKEKVKNINLEQEKKQIAKLNNTKEKYKTMYTNDIITLVELKEKSKDLDEQISKINNKLSNFELLNNINPNEKIKEIINKIKRILSLENITNKDIKEIIEKIEVNKDGEIKIYIKDLLTYL